MKRKMADFICAFFISAFVLLSAVLVTQADFFEKAVKWNKQEATLEVFGSEFAFDKSLPKKARAILKVNDIFTFDGFSDVVENAADKTFELGADVVNVAYTAVKEVMGLK